MFFLPNKTKTLHPLFLDFTNRLDWSYFPQNKIDVIFPRIEIKTQVLISILPVTVSLSVSVSVSVSLSTPAQRVRFWEFILHSFFFFVCVCLLVVWKSENLLSFKRRAHPTRSPTQWPGCSHRPVRSCRRRWRCGRSPVWKIGMKYFSAHFIIPVHLYETIIVMCDCLALILILSLCVQRSLHLRLHSCVCAGLVQPVFLIFRLSSHIAHTHTQKKK